MTKAVARYYDSIAHVYDDVYLKMKYYRVLYRKIGEVIDQYIKPGMYVLDVGSGTGFWSVYMTSKGAHVTSLDISEKSLRRCSCPDRVAGDAALLPVRNNTYDAVTALGSVYNHIQDIRTAFKSAARTLKKGGLFITDIDNALCLDMLYEYLLFQGVSKLISALKNGVVKGVWEAADGEIPFSYYAYFYVKSALAEVGLKLIDKRPIYLLPPLPTRLLQRRFRLGAFEKFDLLKFLAPFSTTVIYIAVKA
ncbi:class I SAM-dependent methyltransferase [Pyrobaculum aerophilum]|uniref:class I SAM-dependent methyltransferase n=1 Tax=Pyrobaculum aerophilum TaxID=13773 RepID=UPI002FDAEFEA